MVAYSIGFESLFHWCWAGRETAMHRLESMTGGRIHYAMNMFGGVRRDITDIQIAKLREDLEELEKAVTDIYEVYRTDRLIGRRLDGIGRLPSGAARELGVVGPTARGSALKFDVRLVSPYAAYPDLEFKLIAERAGDCKARLLVRLRECFEAIHIVEQALDRLPGGPIRTLPYVKLKFLRIRSGEVISRVEAPRGENVHYLVSDGREMPKRVRIRPPTYANLAALRAMSRGAQLADIPAILHSIDPCFGCLDRAVVIDVDLATQRVVRFDQLRGD
jgi:NADH-quinone oxidoreductase subunit D